MAEITKETEVKEVKTEETQAPKTVEVAAPPKKDAPAAKPGQRPARQGQRGNDRRGPRKGQRKGGFKRNTEFEERVVNVARVTTVVKGGRRFSFSVLVVIGDKKGRVGYGHGKANEVPDAIKKAIKDAKRNIITVPVIDGRTVPHEIKSKYVSSNVMLKPAPKGKGIIASGAVRSVVELAGYKDIVTKSLGSSTSTNVVKATLKALSELRTVEQVAKLRDIKPEEVLG